MLIGRGSDRDVDGVLSLDWRQIGGTALTLTPGPGCAACRSFTAPLSVTDETLVFELKASDPEGATVTDSVNVFVRANSPPMVDVGPDRAVVNDASVTLDNAVISFEPEALRYAWHRKTLKADS